MKRDTKIILLACLSVLLLAISVVLLTTNYSSYAILTFTVTIVLVTYTILYYNETRDIYAIYKNELKRILNTYDSILVKSNTLPDMKKRNIIKVATMEDLVYAQMVIKKPIYYYEEEKNCSFVLLDEKEACVYILKTNDDLITATDIIIDEIRNTPTHEDIDHSILDDIENTTIIKLDNHKTYKVSPIKPKNTMKDATQVLDIVNEVKEALEKESKVEEPTFEEEINLDAVAEAIDKVVELSNTGVLNLIKSEPVKHKKIKNVEDVVELKETKKETKKSTKKKDKVVEEPALETVETTVELMVEENEVEEEKAITKKPSKRRKRSTSKKTTTKEN